MHFSRYFSAKNLPEVSPVVMRHNKNWPARYSFVWPDHFSIINICSGRKMENTVWTCEATCKGSHGGRLAQCVG